MNDRRRARRYDLAIPVKLEHQEELSRPEPLGFTREISRSGLYFTTDAAAVAGSMVSLTLTLPGSLTGGDEVLVEVQARIVRVEPPDSSKDGRIGVAARIERYEFVRAVPSHVN